MSAVDDGPLLVVCAGTPWDGPAGSDRLLTTALTRYARVLWVDPPVSLANPAAVRRLRPAPELVPVHPRIVRMTPWVAPLHSRAGVRRVTPHLVRRQIVAALRRLRAQPYAVVDCRLGRLLGGWGPAVRNVLYGTDDFVAGAQLMGRRVAQVKEEERVALAQSDLVLAVSTTLQQRWTAMGATVLLVPNGVQTAAYRDLAAVEPADDVRLSPPIAGVVGHLSARIDIEMLEAVVDAGCALLLVGPYDSRWAPDRFHRLCARPEVQWVGPRPYEQMPRYLRHLNVGLTPYQDSAFNRAAFPLKTLEYLGAGLPAVSTDLPATRWLDTDLIRITSDRAEFGRAARDLAVHPVDPQAAAHRRVFAERHSWPARAELVAGALGLA
ncbi:glycosyltransferase [Solwaraspora sp. WMMD791]|uniref:glycosyltransferase n=1 Tax=Solwaraspora sp. WMMD791 TaxID=3016086 RepID=UPI00249AF64D|nr:glycosyltransferase [Solwaraspora sp. WMMD791]WFE30193.1 glycosyltransferase [Solwaraspora sp. WMMD791]